MKNHSVMLESCIGKGKIVEPSIQSNFEGVESPNIAVTVTEQQKEDDEEIFKKLKCPLVPRRSFFISRRESHRFREGKSSENY